MYHLRMNSFLYRATIEFLKAFFQFTLEPFYFTMFCELDHLIICRQTFRNYMIC